MVLDQLQPKGVFQFFEKLTTIPRGSGNEQEVSDYLVSFAKERGFEYRQDEFNNVIIKKPGTAGYEELPAVILQGHMDMVCEKNNATEFDFEKEALKIKIDGDFITAEGTTLGADNGIAVAMSLALLDSKDVAHPPLEAVFTTDEETGMSGALGIKTDDLKGKYFINIDSETEGEFIVGCAGGQKTTIKLPAKYEEAEYEGSYRLTVGGLKGGHSGEDINKNRGNANKLMGRFLYALSKEVDFALANVKGGAKDNALPRECVAIIGTSDKSKLEELVSAWNDCFKQEYATSDPHIALTVESVDPQTSFMSVETKEAVMDLLNLLPNGIQTMSPDIEGLVESSLNLGVVITGEETVDFILALRSSIKSKLVDVSNRLEMISKKYGAKYIVRGAYPGWAYRRDSALRDLFLKTYKEVYNKEASVRAIHAGLECGIFSEKLSEVDIIAIGPDMEDIHTPDERLSISSTARVYAFLVEVLKNMKK